MQEVHRFQNVIVRLTQEEAGLKEEEAQIHSRYQQRRDDLHEREKMDLRKRKENVGAEVEVFKSDTSVARRIPKAPRFTPVIRCFPTHRRVLRLPYDVQPGPGQAVCGPASMLRLFSIKLHHRTRTQTVPASPLLHHVQVAGPPSITVRPSQSLQRGSPSHPSLNST